MKTREYHPGESAEDPEIVKLLDLKINKHDLKKELQKWDDEKLIKYYNLLSKLRHREKQFSVRQRQLLDEIREDIAQVKMARNIRDEEITIKKNEEEDSKSEEVEIDVSDFNIDK